MSMSHILYAGLQVPTKGLPRWQYIRETPQTMNEGDTLTWSLKCTNAIVGARIIIWFTERVAGAVNWAYDWPTVVKKAAEQMGLAYTKLDFNSVPKATGTYSFMFTVTDKYVSGTQMFVSNIVKKNRLDDQGDIPGGLKGRPLQILIKNIPTAEGGDPLKDGAFQQGSGSYVYIVDSSRKPLGYPTIGVKPYAGDGVSQASGNLKEGDYFVYKVETQNVAPRTQLKVYAANTAQNQIEPSLRNELKRAALAANCEVFVPNWTPETALQWFNGGIVTFTDAYRDDNPITLKMQVRIDDIVEPQQQFDIIFQLIREGDLDEYPVYKYTGNYEDTKLNSLAEYVFYIPTGRYFVYTNGNATVGNPPPTDNDTYSNAYWREFLPTAFSVNGPTKQFQDVPPRHWELRATTNGSTITYSFTGPSKRVGDSVDFSSINPPPGFDAALTAACNASNIMRYQNGKLVSVNDGTAPDTLVFTVPHGGAGKHALRISKPISNYPDYLSYLVIEEACVFLTKPALPFWPRNAYGLNASGGEFGGDWTPVYDKNDPKEVQRNAGRNFGDKYAYNGGRYYYPMKPERPGSSADIINYYWKKGVRLFRFPIKWSRVQPDLFGPLYYGPDVPFTETNDLDMRRIKGVIEYIGSLGGWVLLDVHNFNKTSLKPTYDPTTNSLITISDEVTFDSHVLPTAAHIDLSVKLAQFLEPYQSFVAFDIMNEPERYGSVNAQHTANQMQAVVNAIRARTNYLGRIHTEPSEYASAGNFVGNGNADAYMKFYDPLDNYTIHVHLYNNFDSSGANPPAFVCVAGSGKTKLESITAWARANGRRLHLGETNGGDPAIPDNALCGVIIPQLYQYMIDNADVWDGFTAWGGGFPASYGFTLMPLNNNLLDPVDGGQMKMLEPFLQKTALTTPLSR